MPIPDPLHPAVVHFPIVLLLLGAPLAVVAVFVPRLGLLAAAVLSLAAVAAVAAVQTGELEKRDEIAVPEGEGKNVLRRHEDHGEGSRNAALAAALLSAGSVACRRWSTRRKATLLACVAAVAAVWGAWQVAQAGHTGGELVYRHGVGLRF